VAGFRRVPILSGHVGSVFVRSAMTVAVMSALATYR